MATGYGKLFESMYDGSLADDWRALITMQQLIILADKNGLVDMSIGALHRRTGIPKEHIEAGIAILLAPDPNSRTPGDDGRRIVPIDPARPWGWRLVNHGKYRALLSREEKREADRQRINEKRKAGRAQPDDSRQHATTCDMSQVSQGVADVAHTASTAEAVQVGSSIAIEQISQAPASTERESDQPADEGWTADGRAPRDLEHVGATNHAEAVRACQLMRAAGMIQGNPSHPDLQAAVSMGITAETLAETVTEFPGKGFAYVVKTAIGRHLEARSRPPVAIGQRGTGPPQASRQVEGLEALQALKSTTRRHHDDPDHSPPQTTAMAR
jgi:hypothetical protein